MPSGQWRSWVRRLSEGDEEVVAAFWSQYEPRLHALASKRLGRHIARREGPEDIVQSACRTFLRRAKQGQFRFSEREDLWRLLCAITLAKTREKTRYHLRQRRSVVREQRLDAPPNDSDPPFASPADDQPTPAEAAAFAEQLEHLLGSLDAEERRLVELKLEDCTNEEAARRLSCSERTVRRILKRVQGRLSRLLEESEPESSSSA
jgi:RNA polymerase sigma factor (sigma-70 family)